MVHRDLDFYQAVRSRLAAWLNDRHPLLRHTQLALLPPDLLHLIVRLVVDPRVPPPQKVKLAMAAAYVVLPLDAIPESVLGPAGFADDIAALSYALSGLLAAGHGELAKEHWAGDEDVLELLHKTVRLAEETNGLPAWKRVRHVLQRMVDRSAPAAPPRHVAQA